MEPAVDLIETADELDIFATIESIIVMQTMGRTEQTLYHRSTNQQPRKYFILIANKNT